MSDFDRWAKEYGTATIEGRQYALIWEPKLSEDYVKRGSGYVVSHHRYSTKGITRDMLDAQGCYDILRSEQWQVIYCNIIKGREGCSDYRLACNWDDAYLARMLGEQVRYAKSVARLDGNIYYVFAAGGGEHWMSADRAASIRDNHHSPRISTLVAIVYPCGRADHVGG